MAKKVIKVDIGSQGITQAIQELENYKKEFLSKVTLFRKRFAEELAQLAQSGFDSSGVDDSLKGGTRAAEVSVSVSDNGHIALVIAKGEDAVFCEFGAGVYYNGGVGASPNPYGAELGLTIGSYGEGHGKQSVWGYYADPGDKTTLVLTHGTQATMPMYRAVQAIVPRAVQIAKEVFG